MLNRASRRWKPSGAPFRDVLAAFGTSGEDCCVIGDTKFDILAALDAGIGPIFLLSDEPNRFASFPVEVFPSLAQLKRRLESLA